MQLERTCGSTLRGFEDRISALPEDLLVHILLFIPTKYAVTTSVLSKRWHSVWKLLPQLILYGGNKSVWSFIDKSLQLHKAPVLERLVIQIGSCQSVHVDVVGRWIDKAVERGIQTLDFDLLWSPEPTSLSRSLYTCKTLKVLILTNKILVDVPSQACLPSLRRIDLFYVLFKDEDSLVRLLSSCPFLQDFCVFRNNVDGDNVTNFSVKVPSLQFLSYSNAGRDDLGETNGSLVIDSPRLKYLEILDSSGDSCLMENMPSGLVVSVLNVIPHPNDKFLRCLSSVMYLDFMWTDATDMFCNGITFSRLIECKLRPRNSEYWVESVMILLSNSPQLKVLMITSEFNDEESEEELPLLWNHQSYIPKCLSSYLEIFEWEGYRGRREEKQLLTYILEKSKCLKTVGITPRSTYDNEEKVKIMEELKSMSEVPATSQLIFSVQFNWISIPKHPEDWFFHSLFG